MQIKSVLFAKLTILFCYLIFLCNSPISEKSEFDAS